MKMFAICSGKLGSQPSGSMLRHKNCFDDVSSLKSFGRSDATSMSSQNCTNNGFRHIARLIFAW